MKVWGSNSSGSSFREGNKAGSKIGSKRLGTMWQIMECEEWAPLENCKAAFLDLWVEYGAVRTRIGRKN